MNTTLKKIREQSPCADGWTKLLSHLGKTKADDEPLSIATILESNGLDDALWCLRAVEGCDKEMRLYAVWCARQAQPFMTSNEAIAAIDVAERYANGLAAENELVAARNAVYNTTWGAACAAAYNAGYDAAYDAARASAWASARAAATDAACAAACAAAHDSARVAAHDAALAVERVAAWGAARAAAWGAARDAQEQELLRICGKATEGSTA